MNLHGKHALVLGLAREGVSLARYLAAQGTDVTVTDSAPAEKLAARIASLEGLPVRFVLGGHHPELVSGADVLFPSPGVPETNPVYQAALHAGLAIESMTTLFFDLCPGRIIGITGSSGKTTTTGLIGHILERAGRDVVVGGNIGAPMLDLLPAISPHTLVVLELSSFQLTLLRQGPHIAVVTNISPNHLDRHGTMENYIDAKRSIVRYQTTGDLAVLNADDPVVSSFAGDTPARIVHFSRQTVPCEGAGMRDGVLGTVRDGEFAPVIPAADLPLLGEHNVANVLAALAATAPFSLSAAGVAAAIRSYRPASHRLETVATHNGITYIDDSIATSPARAQVALEAISSPILLIAGGRDKNLPWDTVAGLIARKARALFLIGEAADLIAAAVRPHLGSGALQSKDIHQCPSLADAVMAASRDARPGDVVLLSPGCTSFDMFTDFEERGRAFAQAVGALHATE